MKFAVIGPDQDAIELARAIRRGPHALVAVYAAQGQRADLAMDAAPYEDWEAVLHGTVADVVIVGRAQPEDQRVEQLRKLAQTPLTVIAVHPSCEAIIGYEVEMIRAHSGAMLLAYSPGQAHPILARLAELVRAPDEGPLGPVEQLVFRRLSGRVERAEVLDAFARDALLIQSIVGPLTRLSALGPPADAAQLANLSVHMSGPAELLARWSLEPVDRFAGAELLLLGRQGRARLDMPDDAGSWTLELPQQPSTIVERGQQAEAMIRRAVAAAEMLREAQQPDPSAPAPADRDWMAACHATELSESIPRSLARGRTIELHHEQPSEESTFKSVMAIGSCGLLMAALVVLLGVALADALLVPRGPVDADQPPAAPAPLVVRLWPVYPFVVLLLLQLLWLVARQRPKRKGRQASEAGQESPRP